MNGKHWVFNGGYKPGKRIDDISRFMLACRNTEDKEHKKVVVSQSFHAELVQWHELHYLLIDTPEQIKSICGMPVEILEDGIMYKSLNALVVPMDWKWLDE